MTPTSVAPSALKSAATNRPEDALTVVVLVRVNVPSPCPSRILTFPSVMQSATRSMLPSPLKSPAAMSEGFAIVSTFTGAAKLALPVFSMMLTVATDPLAAARSSSPSSLKSPTAIAVGTVPAAKGPVGSKPIAVRHRRVSSCSMRLRWQRLSARRRRGDIEGRRSRREPDDPLR